jgi:hypothetical protein
MNTSNETFGRILGGFIEESMNNGTCKVDDIGLSTLTLEESLEAQRREEEYYKELKEKETKRRLKKSLRLFAIVSFLLFVLFCSCSPSKSEGPIVEVNEEWEARLEREKKYSLEGTYNLEEIIRDERGIDSYKDVEYIVDLHLCTLAGFYEELYKLPDDSTPIDYTNSFSVDNDYEVADCFGVSRIYDISLERGEISNRQYNFLKNLLGKKFRLVFLTIGDGNYETYIYSEKYQNKPLFTISFNDYDSNVSFFMRDDITAGSFL